MSIELVHEEPRRYTRDEAIAAFDSEDAVVVARALVGVSFYDADWRWVQSQCVRLSTHPSPNVRGLVVTCFGHIARIHRVIDRQVVDPVLDRLAADPDPSVSGRVNDARDDFEMYL